MLRAFLDDDKSVLTWYKEGVMKFLNIKVLILLKAGPWQFKFFINEQKIILLS